MKAKFVPPTKMAREQAIGPPISDKLMKACIQNHEKFYTPMGPAKPGEWLDSQKEIGQTFNQYVMYKKTKIGTKGKTVLYFLPFQKVDEAIIGRCMQLCEAFFDGASVKLMKQEDITKTTVAHRDNGGILQYNAMQIMAQAKQFFLPDAYATLSIMMDDLYPYDSWNYCFGWGEYASGSGVFSMARYDPKFHGIKVDGDPNDIILFRACKIMTHEMTHMFGIWHCIYFRCAMNGINNEEEASNSPLELCPVCLRKLQYNIGFNPLTRYQKIYDVLVKFPMTFDRDRKWIKQRIDYLKSIK
jgi:archaemetzincin